MVYITGIRLANYGSLVTTVRGYHLPKGQAVADRYMFYPDVTINGKTTYAEGFRPQEFSRRWRSTVVPGRGGNLG